MFSSLWTIISQSRQSDMFSLWLRKEQGLYSLFWETTGANTEGFWLKHLYSCPQAVKLSTCNLQHLFLPLRDRALYNKQPHPPKQLHGLVTRSVMAFKKKKT